jgi:hypothetical protein
LKESTKTWLTPVAVEGLRRTAVPMVRQNKLTVVWDSPPLKRQEFCREFQG